MSILKLFNISKKYPGVLALNDINLEFNSGEIHSIVGENGAGKSTFIKIISGVEKQTTGKIHFLDEEITNNSPSNSIKNGINVVYQELNLIEHLSVAENIFYGNEIKKGLFLGKNEMFKKSDELLKTLGVNINSKTLVKDIGVGNQQIVEIAKSLIKEVKVLILDEPTASLTSSEIENLFRILKRLVSQGVCIIYISHRLEEVLEISNKISVFRDGNLIITKEACDVNKKELINYMVGRDLDLSTYDEAKNTFLQEIIFETKNLTTKNIKNVSFNLKKGEIIGIAGLVASGRTELANAIFGIDKICSGDIYINNKKVYIKSPSDAIKNKIALISEDRKNLGLVLNMSIKRNTSYSSLNKYLKHGFLDKNKEEKEVTDILKKLRTKVSDLIENVENLSGGNQQKVVISKWLLTDSEIFIFDEPTRGIDIGAKEEVYKIMEELIEEGKSIIMISSELEEIFRMSDRIFVMSSGQIVSEYRDKTISSSQIFMDSSSLLKERIYE